MKFLFDLFPILLFFGVYKFSGDIYWATGGAIAATVLQVVYCLIRHRKVETMLWVNLVLITLLGGATIYLHNDAFIFWKPTALYLFMALALLAGWYLKQTNLIRKLMGEQITLPDPVWLQMLWGWALFFAAMAAVNTLVIALNCFGFEQSMRVNLKIWGNIALPFAFVIAQSIYLARHIEPETAAAGKAESE